MKALLYKEFKLAMHPACYLIVALGPLMILNPSYSISFIYVLFCYPILFLGANKGQQSNDLLYSVLLPVRKKDIVLARILTVVILQAVFILIVSALYPLALSLSKSIPESETPGIGLEGFVSVVAIVVIGYAIADLIFFPIYYKNGKSIVLSSFLMVLGFVFYIGIFTIVLPDFVLGLEGYKTLLCDSGIGIQFAFLGGAVLISFLLHVVVYKVSSKRLEKVDF